MNDDLKSFLNALGAMAETVGILRDHLIRTGFTREEAITICSSVVVSMFQPKKPKETE